MHDVIVVGAGPAGNMAAFKLSNMGYRVCVLDSRRNLGDKLCTGIIGAECVERFPPHEAHIYHQAKAATVVSPMGNRYRIAREETQGFVIDRVAYVASLADRAGEAGADYRLGPRVSSIEVSDRGVAVLTVGDSCQERYRAGIVIIASGFGSPLLDMVRLRNGGSHPYMVGSQAEVMVNDLDDAEVYLGEEIAPGSFGWLVPIPDSRALMGIVSRRELNGHMGRFISTLQSNGRVGEIIKKPRQWGIPLKPLHKTYGERVLVVGDAAGLVKPTTGGGIYYALLSGEIAAGAANEAFGTGDFSADQLKEYEKEWKALFGRELRIGYYARRLYEALGDQQVERLLSKCVSHEVQGELINSRVFSFDWHSSVILSAVRHQHLGRLLRSFGPAAASFLSRLVRDAP